MPITKDTPGVEIELFGEPEDMQIEGNASAVDPETDAETNTWIRNQLDRGNEWAWCCVHVRVTYNGIVADEYLGGVSCRNEKEVRDEFLPDMVSECIDTINAELTKREPLKISLSKMWTKLQPATQGERDRAVRKVAAEVRASTNYGAKHEYTTAGDQLALAVTSADGTTRVYDCKILRCATFAPDGKQLD